MTLRGTTAISAVAISSNIQPKIAYFGSDHLMRVKCCVFPAVDWVVDSLTPAVYDLESLVPISLRNHRHQELSDTVHDGDDDDDDGDEIATCLTFFDAPAVGDISRALHSYLLSGAPDGTVTMWNVLQDCCFCLRTFVGHVTPINSISVFEAFPSGPVMVSCDESGELCFWDIATGVHRYLTKPLQSITVQSSPVCAVKSRKPLYCCAISFVSTLSTVVYTVAGGEGGVLRFYALPIPRPAALEEPPQISISKLTSRPVFAKPRFRKPLQKLVMTGKFLSTQVPARTEIKRREAKKILVPQHNIMLDHDVDIPTSILLKSAAGEIPKAINKVTDRTPRLGSFRAPPPPERDDSSEHLEFYLNGFDDDNISVDSSASSVVQNLVPPIEVLGSNYIPSVPFRAFVYRPAPGRAPTRTILQPLKSLSNQATQHFLAMQEVLPSLNRVHNQQLLQTRSNKDLSLLFPAISHLHLHKKPTRGTNRL